jgi:hypothetical protein
MAYDAPTDENGQQLGAPPNSKWNPDKGTWDTLKPGDAGYDASWGGYADTHPGFVDSVAKNQGWDTLKPVENGGNSAGGSSPTFDASRVPAGVPMDWAQDFISRNPGDYGRLASAYGSQRTGGNSTPDGSQHPGGSVATWLGSPTSPASTYAAPPPPPVAQTTAPDPAIAQALATFNQWMSEQVAAQKAAQAAQAQAEAARKAKSDALYAQYSDRAHQALNISPEDAIIKANVDPYRAEQVRSVRNAISDAAEKGLSGVMGPAAQAIGAQKAGRATSAFQAELMARELQSRRAEIADALQGMGGILTADQQAGLQRELSNLDQAIKTQQLGISQEGVDVQSGLGYGQLNLDALKTALMNQQYYAGLGSQNDQFLAQLGLQASDRARYYDLVERGLLG